MIPGCTIQPDFTLRTRKRGLQLAGRDYPDLLKQLLALEGVPKANVQDFRRGGEKVRQAILGSIAALYDAAAAPEETIPILGCGNEGSFTENLLYFNDYIEHGRDGGRGQLFVGTLPSTPLCEAAIALNLHGPAFYLDPGADSEQLREEVELLFADPTVSRILVLKFRNGELQVFCPERGGEDLSCVF